MKVIYCASSMDIKDLKTFSSDYTSSKISMLFEDTTPYFIKEFMGIENIEYIEVKDYPDFYKIWNDFMNKMTFAYNYKYLESRKLYEEYVHFNEKMAKRINEIADPNDLVVVNDASLYLLPRMVECKIAVRNLDFDDCFIERVPYYREIVRELMKVNKFFSSKEAMASFKRYLMRSYEFFEHPRGPCNYIRKHVNKEAVLDVLSMFSVYKNSLSNEDFPLNNDLLVYMKTLELPKKSDVVLTNVPLLHLEAFIKSSPGTNIRYVRSSVEIDDKQDRMIQYLKKVYNCKIDVIDKRDYNVIALEMFYCDIFVGAHYAELAKIMRKPYLSDDNDPNRMMRKIREKIGKMGGRKHVYGEEEYLKEFIRLNDYEIIYDRDPAIDDQIDAHVLELSTWACGKENDKTVALSSGEALGGAMLYKRTVGGESALYRKRTVDNTAMPIRQVPECSSSARSLADSMCHCAVHGTDESNTCKIVSKLSISEQASETSEETEDAALEEAGVVRKPMREPPALNISKLLSFWKDSNRIALLDYDGTLTKIEEIPEMAMPTEELLELLRKFSKKNKLILCTGRSKDVVDEWFPPEIDVYAEHGACFRKNGKWVFKERISRIDECVELMEYYHIRTPGSIIEKKSHGCTFHYRLAKDFDVEKLFYLLRRIAGDAVVLGKEVIEVRSASKREVAEAIGPALVAGDDVVDEEMFEVSRGISICVGSKKSKADYKVETVKEFLKVIKKLSE